METHAEVMSDLTALTDYIVDQVTNCADVRPLDELAEQRIGLQYLAGVVRTAIIVLEQEMAKKVESGARQIGDKVYARSKNFKSRWDHSNVANSILERAKEAHTNPETGEVDYHMVASAVLRDLAAVYLSDSTTGKVRTLDALGIDRDAVINKEFVGYKLSVTDLAGDDGG